MIFSLPVNLPKSSKILKVRLNETGLYIWVECDPVNFDDDELFKFHIIGTGHKVPEDYIYLDTVFEGIFVWHIYYDKL